MFSEGHIFKKRIWCCYYSHFHAYSPLVSCPRPINDSKHTISYRCFNAACYDLEFIIKCCYVINILHDIWLIIVIVIEVLFKWMYTLWVSIYFSDKTLMLLIKSEKIIGGGVTRNQKLNFFVGVTLTWIVHN